jgi:transcriptional regulator with XRE-family HTH domain
MKDITRDELIHSKEYWVARIQVKLFAEVDAFMKAHKLNRTQFAEYLGCTKGYVTQLLSGDYDNKLSKLVELSLAIGKAPELEFVELDALAKSGESVYFGASESDAFQTIPETNGKVFVIDFAASA